MVRMAPFNRNIVTPTSDTTTGCDDRWSRSGNVSGIVSTDPKLVPTHSVGQSTVGSTFKFPLCSIRNHLHFYLYQVPDFLVYESANAKHCIASELMFSRELMELDRDLEKELSSLSTRPINTHSKLVQNCSTLTHCIEAHSMQAHAKQQSQSILVYFVLNINNDKIKFQNEILIIFFLNMFYNSRLDI